MQKNASSFSYEYGAATGKVSSVHETAYVASSPVKYRLNYIPVYDPTANGDLPIENACDIDGITLKTSNSNFCPCAYFGNSFLQLLGNAYEGSAMRLDIPLEDLDSKAIHANRVFLEWISNSPAETVRQIPNLQPKQVIAVFGDLRIVVYSEELLMIYVESSVSDGFAVWLSDKNWDEFVKQTKEILTKETRFIVECR